MTYRTKSHRRFSEYKRLTRLFTVWDLYPRGLDCDSFESTGSSIGDLAVENTEKRCNFVSQPFMNTPER